MERKSRPSESEYLADQMHRAFHGEAWHGSALLELLADVDAEMAASHPITGVHSIWEIVNHLNAWTEGIGHRAHGKAFDLEGDDDWPPVHDASATAWKRTLTEWKHRHAELEKLVAELKEAQLDQKVANRPHDVRFMLHGYAQHDLYHAGQIALLRKALKH